jgi:hypothetical protein
LKPVKTAGIIEFLKYVTDMSCMCWPPTGFCSAISTPYAVMMSIVMGIAVYVLLLNDDIQYKQSHAIYEILILVIGVPLLTILSMSNLLSKMGVIPEVFETLWLLTMSFIGFVLVYLLGLGGFFAMTAGVAVLTAALSKELIAEYA